ncbi:MAG: discoidin domain-containing protein, partial [Candidatus Auribacterota bacterium]|nr:discoidin domain-containing protein [Candidatus Auribacterota bacterium]
GFIVIAFLFLSNINVQTAEAGRTERKAELETGRVSRLTFSLNGKWKLEASKEKPKIWGHSIVVPGLVDMAEPSINWKSQSCFWYKKTFTLTPNQARSHAFIKIGLSKYGTEVWLNGKYIGSYMGCYTSHEYNATKAINYNGANTLIVKVGTKDALPKTSPVGHDYEKQSFIPGIWGDVALILVNNPVIKRIQIIPHIDTSTAEAKITLRNLENKSRNVTLAAGIFEKKSGRSASNEVNTNCTLSPMKEKTVILNIPISDMKLWAPDSPFLYTLVASVKVGDKETDRLKTAFGMREFKIVGSDFYLNGKRVFLKGSNIAFHRFLSDPDRKDLPWDKKWIKKVLIDVPKAHNFNFFRNHLGQMYNKWYDIADEYGMLLQNEWAFWVITGTEKQIKKEFTQWIYDNWNHPSIIIWDAMNEPSDDGRVSRGIIRDKVIPEMKKLDSTRPWECGLNNNVDFKFWRPKDFSEEHPYIYSLGPVLNNQDFGFSRSIGGIENSKEPTMLNEFVWFWLDKNGNRTSLTAFVLPRWLGKNPTRQQQLDHQARLASDLCELFRRMDVDGIAPFVYLSLEGGATSNWLTGDISNPGVKPVMTALKDVFAPFGVSIELWDRHFFPREKREINVYVFNDTQESRTGVLDCKITSEDGSQVFFESNLKITVPPISKRIKKISWTMPPATGTYCLKAELREGSEVVATSKKIAHVYKPVIPDNLSSAKIMIYDPDNEILDYVASAGLKNVSSYSSNQLSSQDILVLGEGALLDSNYNNRLKEINNFVKKGHSLIVVEPSYGVRNYKKKEYVLLPELSMAMNRRRDKDDGGYDSYCFAEDANFSLWNNIDVEHLKMFNGAFGGEMISQCDVDFKCSKLILAKSGLSLKYPDVIETIWEKGVIVISRIQVRGRLIEESDTEKKLYSRRVDPVAQQYLLNLLSTYLNTAANYKRIKERLPFYIRDVSASSVQGDNDKEAGPDKAVDGSMDTRWSSGQRKNPQWIVLDFGKIKNFSKIILHWENAYATAYKVQVSNDAKNWETIYTESNSDGGTDIIKVQSRARYMRIFGTERNNEDWGYSLWEIEVR